MYRNTTPTLPLVFKDKETHEPVDITIFDDYLVTFKYCEENGEINKYKKDCETLTSQINVTLTQEETLLLPEDEVVKIQVQFYKDNKVLATNIFRKPVKEILYEIPRK